MAQGRNGARFGGRGRADQRAAAAARASRGARRARSRRVSAETRYLQGIKQGVGMVTAHPFPKEGNGGRSKVKSGRRLLDYFNALSPCHLALPRATAPYIVVRTTTTIHTASKLMLFGPMTKIADFTTESPWSTVIAVFPPNDAGMALPMDNALNLWTVSDKGLDVDGFGLCRLAPSAFTVQIMNPEALQTTSGIAYIGRSKNIPDLMQTTRTWQTYIDSLVSFCAPRLCSAGKLALRGVQASLMPGNMSKLAEFAARDVVADGNYTWTGDRSVVSDMGIQFNGFCPMFVYNPDKIGLRYLVTVEYRVRFDPSNPAHAGATMHPPPGEGVWSRAIEAGEALGHGVEDIADVVADVGYDLVP